MVCSSAFQIESVADFLVWPTGCDFYFYLKIFLTILLILTWTLYKHEKKIRQNSELLSSLAVSSVAILVLGLIGSLIENSAGIAMISSEVLLLLLAILIPIILIWIFKK